MNKNSSLTHILLQAGTFHGYCIVCFIVPCDSELGEAFN